MPHINAGIAVLTAFICRLLKQLSLLLNILTVAYDKYAKAVDAASHKPALLSLLKFA